MRPGGLRQDTLLLHPLTPDIPLPSLGDSELARDILEEALQIVVDRRLRCAPLPVADSSRPAQGRATTARRTSGNPTYAAAENNDVVQDILSRFNADIISREPSPQERWEQRHAVEPEPDAD